MLVLDLLVCLAAALVVGLICERIGLNSIVGYLVAGVVIGPGALGFVRGSDQIRAIAEIGVALLLFTIGLEFSWRQLAKLGRGGLLGGTLVTGILTCITTGVTVAWGKPWQVGVMLGMIISLSSTAVVLRILKDRNELDSRHGRASMGFVLVQDVLMVPLLIIATFLSKPVGDVVQEMGGSVLRTLLLVGIFVVVVSVIIPRLLTAKLVAKNRELPILLAITACIGATWAAHELQISPALGAFFAGMLLAENKFADQMRADVLPLRTLFVTIFFVSVGLLADLQWLGQNLVLVLTVTSLVLLLKTLVTYLTLRPFMLGSVPALATALAVNQIGEFSFVLATIGLAGGLLSQDIFQLVVSTTLLTLLVAPFFTGNAERLSLFLAKRLLPARKLAAEERKSKGNKMEGHVILVGFGEAGQEVGSVLAYHEIPTLVLEINPDLADLAISRGLSGKVGDASQTEILSVAGISTAKCLALAIPNTQGVKDIITTALSLNPELMIIVRARYHVYAQELDILGADVVVDEEVLVGRILGQSVSDFYIDHEGEPKRPRGSKPRAGKTE